MALFGVGGKLQAGLRFDLDWHRVARLRRSHRDDRPDVHRDPFLQPPLQVGGLQVERFGGRIIDVTGLVLLGFIGDAIGKALGLRQYAPRFDQPGERALGQEVE